MTLQEDIHTGFLWARQTYREGRLLLEDTLRIFSELGLTPPTGGLWTAYASTIQRDDDFPFVYLACQFFCPVAEHPQPHGSLAFAGISFHQDRHIGPLLLGGVVQCSDNKSKANHWLVNHTARIPGQYGYYDFAGDPIVVHRPTSNRPKECQAVVDEVRHVEVPLTAVRSSEQVAEFVAALVAMRNGDDAPVTRFVLGIRGATVG